ncbi:MAG: hypothetical protein A2Y50_04540 [Pseudomonadales bacterium RIFCSPLOWO2_12_59_9]|nr:MAG: hypothetical protein A2Y50_04540 [Pseudomonadales bacterium RIFCSPLOWO2_12_59_9]
MTTTSYLGGTVDQIYNPASFDWLNTLEQQEAIKIAVDVLGVSAGALVGAMAEENTSYLASETSQSLFDDYALSSLDPAAFAAALLIGIPTAEILVAVALINPRTHEQFLADYEALRAADQLDEHGLDAKVLHPALADLGPANFKLATAITLLNDYLCSSSNADDPLGLSGYASHYDLLAADLVDPDRPTAAKFYGLMLQKAEKWFTDADSAHCAYGARGQVLHFAGEQNSYKMSNVRPGPLCL